jgi:hypothetical protein
MFGNRIGVVGYFGKTAPKEEFMLKGIDKLPVSGIL